MSSFRLSRVGMGVLMALSLGSTVSAQAADATTDKTTSSSDQVETITVHGSQVDIGGEYQGGQVARASRAGLLGNVDMMDSPFSTTSYTSQLIADQQAKSVADVLQNDPTVRVAKGFGNFQELYMIRGFNVYSDDMTLNGVYGILPRQFVAAEMMERVEVFRGANTFLNGAAPGGSAIGGLVNIVPKRAGSEPLNRVTLGTQTGGQGYAAMDWSRRFGAEQSDGLRINIVGRDGEDGVDDQDTQLGAMSIGWDHQDDKLRLSADFGYQDSHIDSPRPSVTPSGSAPSTPNASSNYAQDWTYTDEKQLFGVVRGEYDLSDTTTAWVAVGGRHGKEHNLLGNPTSDSSGNVTIYAYENVREDNIISADSGIRHEFETGDIGHSLVLSASAYHAALANAYTMTSSYSAGSLYDYSQSAQSTSVAYSGGDLDDPEVTERDNYSSLALADTLSMFDDQVKWTIGGRYQRIDVTTYDYNGKNGDQYAKNAVTPFTGVVYQPTLEWSLYANYAESLLPGDTAPTTHTVSGSAVPVTNAGEVMSPLRSKQYETGAKYDNGSYGATVSLFQISKPSYRYSGNTYTDNGEQRNRGIELSGFGQVFDQVKVLGGVTLIDAELVKTSDGSDEGNNVIGVPEVTANLNLEWATPFVDGLTFEGRTVYTGSQYIDESNDNKIPSWTRFDLGARYKMTVDKKPLTLRARVENVTDKDYWASAGGYPGSNYLVQGAPRTVMISASYDF
ncbi:TonB-dependent receptor [Vibrio porteresiae]|uniref:TonB-dependent siderophore receptor n=1 Tax=Vibrio porteresiae DSM 19223 TaxID=1123496 RepID=A0ABZ0QF53_9VIBR|nr:TonB-dependent siderophore receptor [Vibrio porteresiae]WPC74210.1 TonB-dependent siderophore receptor [Vibrio porteresiae DSM 19223]